MSVKDGGSAFPVPPGNISGGGDQFFPTVGMSLRDYFAAKAMHSELMTNGVPGEACDAMVNRALALGVDPRRHMANNAYEMADAMLAARGTT